MQLTTNLEHLSEGSLANLCYLLVLVNSGAEGEVVLVYVPLLVLSDAGWAGLVVAGAGLVLVATGAVSVIAVIVAHLEPGDFERSRSFTL